MHGPPNCGFSAIAAMIRVRASRNLCKSFLRPRRKLQPVSWKRQLFTSDSRLSFVKSAPRGRNFNMSWVQNRKMPGQPRTKLRRLWPCGHLCNASWRPRRSCKRRIVSTCPWNALGAKSYSSQKAEGRMNRESTTIGSIANWRHTCPPIVPRSRLGEPWRAKRKWCCMRSVPTVCERSSAWPRSCEAPERRAFCFATGWRRCPQIGTRRRRSSAPARSALHSIALEKRACANEKRTCAVTSSLSESHTSWRASS
mmetsp:Transcript_50311/g.133581  ORF Transcript_50311/g.133581 Transcript_50311/m.133581 type:complete len:254 (-) Transcript_50311:2519-3280(-)